MKIKQKEKTILIIGGRGFVGSNFLQHLSLSKGIIYKTIAPNHSDLDILSIEQLRAIISYYRPDVVINFAAHRDANSAEKQRGNTLGSVWQTNVFGVSNIIKICKEYDSFLIHISTDMVFSGSVDNPGPYGEKTKVETKMNKLSWYGWSKREAERIVSKYNKSAIIRIGNVTQHIYDPRLDYIGKIIWLYDCGQLYALFQDQYLTLTPLSLLFKVIEKLINNSQYGVFHVATHNTFTPFELGEYLIKSVRGKTKQLQRISIDTYLRKKPNRYPKYGGLLARETARRLHIRLPDWRQVIDQSVVYFRKE